MFGIKEPENLRRQQSKVISNQVDSERKRKAPWLMQGAGAVPHNSCAREMKFSLMLNQTHKICRLLGQIQN